MTLLVLLFILALQRFSSVIFRSLVRTVFLYRNIRKYGRIYCIKKDVLTIFRNKPLLFVDGPPVFIKVAIIVEESTSVFFTEAMRSSLMLENEEAGKCYRSLAGESRHTT